MKLSKAIYGLQEVFNELGHPELIVLQFSTDTQMRAFYTRLLETDKTITEPIGGTEGRPVLEIVGQKVQLTSRIKT